MAVSTLMAASGKSHFSRHVFERVVRPGESHWRGAVLFWGKPFGRRQRPVLGYALAFCAGSFLCIASSDLLPELQFHSHDRLKLSAALLPGLTVAIIIKHFKPLKCG